MRHKVQVREGGGGGGGGGQGNDWVGGGGGGGRRVTTAVLITVRICESCFSPLSVSCTCGWTG